MKIQGKRIVLRPIVMDDLSDCVRWTQDADVVHHVMQKTKTIDECREWLIGILSDSNQKVFIIEDQNAKSIGNCAVHFIPTDPVLRDEEGLSIGILIGEKDAWGKGYGPEVMALLSEHVHKAYGVKRVWLTVDTLHIRAIRAYEKAGFLIVREMLAPQRIHSDGRQFIMERRFPIN